MPEETEFNQRFNLLSKVVKAGRDDRHRMDAEQLERIVQAYRESPRDLGDKNRGDRAQNQDVRLSKDAVRKLTTPEVKELLESNKTSSINGVDRAVLKRRFNEVKKLSDEGLASKVVKEILEREPARRDRHLQTFKHLREEGRKEKEKNVDVSERRRNKRGLGL